MKKITSLLLPAALLVHSVAAMAVADEAWNAAHDQLVEALVGNMADTGQAVPAIDDPRFVSVYEANQIWNDETPVFLLVDAPARIYPQPIMARHQVVNDFIDDNNAAITYCPLTGSVKGYYGDVNLYENSYEASGKLINGNTVLIDRATGSLWSQLTGEALDGPIKGAGLCDGYDLIWTTWGAATKLFPNAVVLACEEDTREACLEDSYGSYESGDTYYQNHEMPFALTTTDDRLPPKERIYGLIAGTGPGIAVVEAAVREAGVINFNRSAMFWVPELGTARQVSREFNGQTFTFVISDGVITDLETGTEWNPYGQAVAGPFAGAQLWGGWPAPCMWFAWAAFHPDTELVTGDQSP